MADSPNQEAPQGFTLDGLWTAEFGSSAGMFGGGIVVFQGGKLLGGDGTHFYMGDYTLVGNTLTATLRVSPFIEGAESVFKTRRQDLTLEIVGTLTADGRATATGQARELPQLKFGVKLTKRP